MQGQQRKKFSANIRAGERIRTSSRLKATLPIELPPHI